MTNFSAFDDWQQQNRDRQTRQQELFKRRVKKGRACLNPCTYVTYGLSQGIKFFAGVTDPTAQRVHALPTIPGYVSWAYSEVATAAPDIFTGGICAPVFDGSGQYATEAACIADNFDNNPRFFSVSDTAFTQANFYTQDSSFVTQDLSSPGDDENDINAGLGITLQLSGVLPYERDAGGGEFETVVESGIVPGNVFDLKAAIATVGTTSPPELGTPTFDGDRYHWSLWENTSNPGEYFFREYFLSTDTSVPTYTSENGGAPSSTWSNIGGGIIRYTWNNYTYAQIISATDETLTFTRTTEARQIPPGTQTWEFRKSQTRLNLNGALYRDAFEQAFASNRWDALFCRGLDPLTYMQQAGPIFRNNDQYNPVWAITEHYFVDTGDGKIHLFWKYGKIRNPAISYLQREWLVIEQYTLDYTAANIATTNKAILTVQQFINPAPVPNLEGNALQERTNSYAHDPTLTDPCVEQIDNIQNEEIKFGALCQIDSDGPDFEKRTFKETHLQEDCLGRIRVYRLQGQIAPSSATCTNPS